MFNITERLTALDAEVTGTPVRENGRMVCQIRCRIPVQMDITNSIKLSPARREEDVDGGEDSIVEETPSTEYKAKEGESLVIGVASSTSVDWHGTEMSLMALQNMAEQFKRGVAHVPGHMDDEWDQMIGKSVDAEIEQREVVQPAPGLADVGEPQYILRVFSAVYEDTERGKMLLDRIGRGDTIGWSIGGWFTDMRVIYDDDEEEIERVIIDSVELDHLAVTRKPSNPDSWLEGMRSKAVAAIDAYRSKSVRLKDDEEDDDAEEATDEAVAEIDEEAGEEEEIADEEDEEKKGRAEEDKEEQEDHDEGAIKDDEDQIEDLEDDKEEEEEDLKEEEEEKAKPALRMIVPFQDLAIDFDRDWNWDTTARDEILGKGLDNWKRYKQAHIYMDTDKDPESKGAYKLPIARMVDDKLMAIWNGVVAAMAAVNGARGGVNISDDERREAYNHLAKYYKKADKDPPEMRAEAVYEDPPGPPDEPGDGTDAPVDPTSADDFADEGAAKIRGEALGCGLFAHQTEGGRFMPCKSAEVYQEALYVEDANPDGVATLTGDDEMGGVELSRRPGRKTQKSDILEDINVDIQKQGRNTNPTGDSLMSNETDRTGSAPTRPDETVVAALNEKLEALTRTVKALTKPPHSPQPKPAPVADERFDAIARNMEALTAFIVKREEAAVEDKVEKETEAATTEADQLRGRLALLEEKISLMAAKPQRRVVRYAQERRLKDVHPDAEALSRVDESQGGASALAVVARDMEEVIYYDKRLHGKDKRPDRDDLKEALRAVLMAASVDGLIHNPDFA